MKEQAINILWSIANGSPQVRDGKTVCPTARERISALTLIAKIEGWFVSGKKGKSSTAQGSPMYIEDIPHPAEDLPKETPSEVPAEAIQKKAPVTEPASPKVSSPTVTSFFEPPLESPLYKRLLKAIRNRHKNPAITFPTSIKDPLERICNNAPLLKPLSATLGNTS